MARNLEKQRHALNKYLEHSENIAKGLYDGSAQRPRNVAQVTDLGEAERWLKHLKQEVRRKISQIQNGAQPESVIRDVNDDINKLLRTRKYWEEHIVSLGGKDHGAESAAALGSGGPTADAAVLDAGVLTYNHYHYFGAAKDLPGVRDFLEKNRRDQVERKRKTRKELFSNILPDYYGWRDEDDVDLLLNEVAVETELSTKRRKRDALLQGKSASIFLPGGGHGGRGDDTSGRQGGQGRLSDSLGFSLDSGTEGQNLSYVYVPTDEEIEAMLTERKRELALAKVARYISREDQQKQDDAKMFAGSAPPTT